MTDQDKSESRARASRKTSEPSSTQRTVFVVSPIGKTGSPEHRRARLVLDYIIKKAFRMPEWKVIRADDEDSPDSITTQVIDRIVKSDLIVADLTGHNPNVFYELAVAHGYQRPVVHMITEGESMPFDITDQRAIFYDLADPASVDNAISKMASFQAWLEENPDTLRTPLSTHGAFTAISSTPPGTESNEVIAQALSEMVLRLGRLERTTERSLRRSQEGAFSPSVSSRRLDQPLNDDDRALLVEKLVEIDEELTAMSSMDGGEETMRRLSRERERIMQHLRRQP